MGNKSEKKILICAIKEVLYSCKIPHTKAAASPHWVYHMETEDQGTRQENDIPATATAVWKNCPLSLSQESRVFCQHQWNYSELTYL